MCVCRWVPVYSHGSHCFLGKDSTRSWGRGHLQELGGVRKAFPALTAEQHQLNLSLMTWEPFISRMSIMACHPTGKAKETSRKSINRQYVDQWAAGTQTLLWHCCPLVDPRTQFRHNEPHFFKFSLSVFCCVCVYRCVHTNSCWGRDDACGLPRMLWCHSGIAVSAGDSECLSLWLCNFHTCFFCLIISYKLFSFLKRVWDSNTLTQFLCLVFLLFGDPLCLWSGCSNLGFHEQGHSKKKHTPTDILHFTSAPVNLCVAVFPKQSFLSLLSTDLQRTD